MKKIYSVISVTLLVFLLSACSNFSEEASVFNSMIDLDSYHAEMSITEMNLGISVKKHYYKDGDMIILRSNEQEVTYSFEEDEKSVIVFMEDDYYEFEVSSNDLIHVLDFEYLKSMDFTETGEGRYFADSNVGNLDNFMFVIEDDLISSISFELTTEVYYTLRYLITFDSYDDINFSFEEEPITPTTRQLKLYEFYENGYILRISPVTVRLFGLDHTIYFGLDIETIKIYLEDGYIEIYPDTMQIGIVTSSVNIVYSYDDYFRFYTELIFTKDEIDDIVNLYNIYIS